MNKKQKNFIEVVGKLARNEYMARDRWILPSVCIAQAILESGWNLHAKTLFGIKGNGVKLNTQEFVGGKYVNVVAEFKSFPNIAQSVVGYYDFLANNGRYSNIICNNSFTDVCMNLQIDGYATDPRYAYKLEYLIIEYGLNQYDIRENNNSNKNVCAANIKVGTKVRVSSYYTSSTDNIDRAIFKNAIGVVTKIRIAKNSKNPYLLNNGKIGWCNLGDIREIL